jgi:hypothetical protein
MKCHKDCLQTVALAKKCHLDRNVVERRYLFMIRNFYCKFCVILVGIVVSSL